MMKKIAIVAALVGALVIRMLTERGTAIAWKPAQSLAVLLATAGAALQSVQLLAALQAPTPGESVERRGYCVYRDRYGRRYEARCPRRY